MAAGRRLTIVSGGQAGVDRGALDAALAAGAPCTGWCPPGRRAEDGVIAERYPLHSLPRSAFGYAHRTRANVRASDGTVIVHWGRLHGGTALTRREAWRHARPLLLLNASRLDPGRAARRLTRFVRRHAIGRLNVAGPRASAEPRARDWTARMLDRALTDD